MRRLILSDIHANLPAFEAVIEDAGKVDEIVFLGDLANFGPHPSECVNLMRELSAKCIMGNHDYKIADKLSKRNFWDEWTRTKLNQEQLDFIASFKQELIIENTILALHGIYTVDYDILPNTSENDIVNAFMPYNQSRVNNFLFGHYHYQIDKKIKGKEYHCIRPVGHHRDKDTRASYSILENGILSHHRIPYDIEKTIFDVDKIECMDESRKIEWKNFLRNAFDAELLKKDLQQMQMNEEHKHD